MKPKRLGEYKVKQDYHLKLDPNWPYLPVYLEKIKYVRNLLDKLGRNKKIIDLGCGEGALVQEYYHKGFNIKGMDLNYQSKYVSHGNILNTKLPKNSFDMILCLDVLEHLNFKDQELAIEEMARILKPKGKIILSLPNLAHLASRFTFLFLGKLLRTSDIHRHPGDRPVNEYLKLLSRNFKIIKVKGFFPTLPLISLLTLKIPSKIIFLHKIYNYLLAYPPFCFENIIIAKKTKI